MSREFPGAFECAKTMMVQMQALQRAGVPYDAQEFRKQIELFQNVVSGLDYSEHLFELSRWIDETLYKKTAMFGTQYVLATVCDQTWVYFHRDERAAFVHDTFKHSKAHLFETGEDARLATIDFALRGLGSWWVFEVYNVPEFKLRPDTW